MKIVYCDEKEKEFYENGGFQECLDKRPSMKMVKGGGEFWVGFKVTNELMATAFIYDLIAAMNHHQDDDLDALNTDFVGVEVTQIGQHKHESKDFTDKINQCIEILSSTLS